MLVYFFINSINCHTINYYFKIFSIDFAINNKIFSHIAVTLMLLALLGLFKPIMGSIGRSDFYATLRIGLMQLVSFYSIVCFISSFIEARKKR